jgi:hypothetical protein
VSYQLTLVLDSGAQVDIETETLLSNGPPGALDTLPARLVPERHEVAPALPLIGAKVASSVVFKSGRLHLLFGTGVQLTVQPHPQHEAWSARGPAGPTARLPAGWWSSPLVVSGSVSFGIVDTRLSKGSQLVAPVLSGLVYHWFALANGTTNGTWSTRQGS